MTEIFKRSTDVSIEHSYAFLLNNGTFIYKEDRQDTEELVMYVFDVLNEIPDWVDLEELNSTCGTAYALNNVDDYFLLTCDVCSYYGALNLDNYPEIIKYNELEEFFNRFED